MLEKSCFQNLYQKREEVNNNVGIEQLIKLLTEEQVDPE